MCTTVILQREADQPENQLIKETPHGTAIRHRLFPVRGIGKIAR